MSKKHPTDLRYTHDKMKSTDCPCFRRGVSYGIGDAPDPERCMKLCVCFAYGLGMRGVYAPCEYMTWLSEKRDAKTLPH